jgi:hypothetical protein
MHRESLTGTKVARAMKAIVLVTLAIDAATGAVDPTAPFVVSPPPPHQRGVCEKEPAVIAQFLPGEQRARFEAEWTEGRVEVREAGR